MKKTKKVYKIILILLIFITIVNCVALFICFYKVNNIEHNITSMQNTNTGTLQNNISQTEAYKLMYENQKDSNSKIIETVYWALGALATVILGIIGTNVFFNFRVNKKDIESITNNMNTTVEQIKGDMYKIIQTKIDDYIQRSGQKFENDFLVFEQKQDAQIKLFSDNLDSKINSVVETLKTNISTNYSEQNRKYDTLTKSINTKYIELQIIICDCIAQLWMLRHVNANSIIYYVRKGEFQLEIGRDVELTLNEIIKILKETSSLSTYYSEINKFINKLPDCYEIQKETIIKLVQEIRDTEKPY